MFVMKKKNRKRENKKAREREKIYHWQSATNEAGIKDRYNRTTEALAYFYQCSSRLHTLSRSLKAPYYGRRLAVAFHDFNYTLVHILRDCQPSTPEYRMKEPREI